MKPTEYLKDENTRISDVTHIGVNAFNRGYIAALLRGIELSDSVYINSYGSSVWFTVTNREDLQKLMTLAPQWAKSNATNSIDYTASVDGIDVKIAAQEDALPPTCQLVEETVTIPAQPERQEVRKVVKCRQPEPIQPAEEVIA